MKFSLRSFFTKNTLFDMFMQTVGSAIFCIGLVSLAISNGILSSGFTALSVIVNHYLPFAPISVVIYIFNAPLLIWALIELNKRFVFYTIYTVTIQSVFIEILGHLPCFHGDILLAAIFGGVVCGIGSGILIRRNSSGGGTEVLGVIIKKKWGFSVGTVGLAVNIAVMSLSAILFGLETVMYTILFIFIFSMMTDKVIAGFGKKYTVMIITSRPEEVKAAIFNHIRRGMTILKGKGAFSGDPKDIIYCALNQFELAVLKDLIYKIDPGVFMTISETNEIHGHFRSLKGDGITLAELETGLVNAVQEPVRASVDAAAPRISIIDKDHEVIAEQTLGEDEE